MKRHNYFLQIMLLSFIFIPFVTTGQTFDVVIGWMYENQLTKYDNASDFRSEAKITRGEISKFFSNYAKLQALVETKTDSECQFSDIVDYDATLKPTIIQACKYGLIKGYDGKYFPNNELSEAEALAVIIRSVQGFQDESVSPRRSEYYRIGKAIGILDSEGLHDIEKKITREKVGTWLYRISHLNSDASNQGSVDDTENNNSGSIITTVNEDNIDQIIEEACSDKRPKDFSMRAYCEDEQFEAVRTLEEGKPGDISQNDFEIIREECADKRGNDFSMRVYCEEQQFEAVRTLEEGKPDDISQNDFDIVREECTDKRGNDFSMRVYCEEQQFEAIRTLEEGKPDDISQNDFDIVREECTDKRGNDYSMRVYCEDQEFKAIRELNN